MHYRCIACSQHINKERHRKPHTCGEKYCKICKDFVDECHQCYINPVDHHSSTRQSDKSESDSRKRKMLFIFFDFECTQEDMVQCEEGYKKSDENGIKFMNCRKSNCGVYEHRPNLCVAHKVCELCLDKDITDTSVCDLCGENERIFTGPSTTDDFCRWLFSEVNTGCTAICHNFKAYDSYPILEYLQQNAILPEVISTGSKFMSIDVPQCKLRMIDSINFLPMSLSELPRTFGEEEISKGYFPHLFNRKENHNKVFDYLPDIKFYNPDSMKPEWRTEFMNWYSQHKDDLFEFNKELLRYCKSDVDILRKCCLKFRKMFMEITTRDEIKGIDSFEKCITIVSVCNSVYMTLYLESERIGIIPPHGYRPEQTQYIKALH